MRQQYIVQIEDGLLATFIAYWLDYNKPCPLLFRRPHTDGLRAILLTVDASIPDSVMFLARAVNATGCKLYSRQDNV